MPLGNLATKIREAKTSEVEPQVSEGISEAVLAEPSKAEASERQMIDTDQPPPIVAAPAIQDPREKAFTLACCYLWLVDKNMDMRKKEVIFSVPDTFAQLVEMGLLDAVPAKANWQTWNKLHGEALCCLEKFEDYHVALRQVMCDNSHHWRDKMLVRWNEILDVEQQASVRKWV